MSRTFPRRAFPNGVPDAKIEAMVNDLSPEGLCSLMCMSPYLLAKFRQLVCDQYRLKTVQAVVVIDAWEADGEA